MLLFVHGYNTSFSKAGEKRVLSKASGLQEAQVAMRNGRTTDGTGKTDLRHPYFWAP